MSTRDDLARQWVAEYTRGGIPSSVRQTPSGAVVWATEELKRRGLALGHVLRAGSGKGRNSIYLAQHGAEVTAMNFTEDAIDAVGSAARAQGLTRKIMQSAKTSQSHGR